MREGGARRGDGWPGQHARGGTAGASHGRVYEAPHPRAKHVLAPLSDSERAAADAAARTACRSRATVS